MTDPRQPTKRTPSARVRNTLRGAIYLGSLLKGLLDPTSYRAAAGYALSGDVPLLAGVVAFFFLVEWAGRERAFALAELGSRWRTPLRWTFYYAVVAMILTLSGSEQQFIYFQF